MASVPSELGARGDKQARPIVCPCFELKFHFIFIANYSRLSQDVAKIYGALHSCIAKLPKDQLRRVIHIAVCGQMHGVVLWKQGEAWSRCKVV